jgi:hypothetical protein
MIILNERLLSIKHPNMPVWERTFTVSGSKNVVLPKIRIMATA